MRRRGKKMVFLIMDNDGGVRKWNRKNRRLMVSVAAGFLTSFNKESHDNWDQRQGILRREVYVPSIHIF